MRILLFLFFAAISASAATDTGSIVGKPAPSFRLSNQNMAKPAYFNLSEHFSPDSQHVVMVSFFATWCVPCRLELPFLQHCADSLRHKGLRMVAVCLDTVYEENQKKMVSDLGLTCPVVSSTTGILAKRFNLSPALPQTVFIDRKGIVKIRTEGFGEKEISVIHQTLDKLLKQ
ncbi:MAG: TlpA family protein disulfide reductase [Chitinispirillaceae bacterium]|nr:TlpA family protein disulfide reductase [Chitinispirillaceae bacterium]